MKRTKQKSLLVLMVFLLVFSMPFVFSDAKESAGKAADAFGDGDVEGIASNTGQLLWEISDSLQLAKIAVIVLGIVIIALIVLRLSNMISKPKIDKIKMKKEKEDREFSKMFDKQEEILDDLKSQLGEEKRRNRK